MRFVARLLQSIGELLAGTVVAFALLRTVPHGPLAAYGDRPVMLVVYWASIIPIKLVADLWLAPFGEAQVHAGGPLAIASLLE